MKAKRKFLFRAGIALALLLIAGAMFIVGRGHTIYFDNKTLEHEGETYAAAYKVVVFNKDKELAKLFKRERGMATWIGQNFSMALEVTQEKGGDAVVYPVSLKLPYHMDGIVLNLPAMLADLPREIYMTEFIAGEIQAVSEGDEEIVVDEFAPSDI